MVVTSLDQNLYICLVPLEDRSSMPAISSLELRPLGKKLYSRGGAQAASNVDSSSKLQTTYLMTVSRWNFGGDESLPAVRSAENPKVKKIRLNSGTWFQAKFEI
ncbi:hypothetical protein Mapa_008794 [Marchantia paleacea]|nr:hypothetical protein Mapa_008794 [Marchantia paleacea]